jgi:putative tricarboxylic transport membrane protein
MTGSQTETKRRPDGATLTIAAGLAGLGGLLIQQSLGIEDKGGYAGIGSGDLPFYIGLCLLALAASHLWVALSGKGTGIGQDAVPPQAKTPLLFILAGLLLQLFLLKPLGFSIASGLLFACTAAAFGKRNWAVTLPVGFVFAFVVYGVFDQLLQLNLPAGLPETLIFGG